MLLRYEGIFFFSHSFEEIEEEYCREIRQRAGTKHKLSPVPCYIQHRFIAYVRKK